MPARVNFGDAGVGLRRRRRARPAAQLVAKLRLAIDAGAIPEGATLPSIRVGAAELGVHSNTLRKVYAALEAQGYATTRHGSGTVAHVRDAAGAAAVRRIADGALASARGEGADAQLVALAILAGEPAHREARPSVAPGRAGRRRRAAAQAAQAVRAPVRHARTRRCSRPTSARRATSASSRMMTALVARAARGGGAARRAPARRRPRDSQTLGDLVWGCELVIVGPRRARRRDGSARAAQRARRSRDGVELIPKCAP